MSNIGERVAYLKGIAEGLKIDESTDEGKLFTKIIDVLGDISNDLTEMLGGLESLNAQIEEIDEDLAEVEDFVFGDGEDFYDESDDFEYDDVTCPKCGETIYLDSDMLCSDEEAIVCPNCGHNFELEYSCGCDFDPTEDEE